MKKLQLATVAAWAAIGLAATFSGCGTERVVDAEAKGMYVNGYSETLAIGSGSLTTIPADREAFAGHYEEDTAWLSPTTKTHKFDVFVVGTNSTDQAASIVRYICAAFGAVAPVLSSNECAKSGGMTTLDLFAAKRAAGLAKIWNRLTPAAQAEINALVSSGKSGSVPVTTTDGTQAEVKCEDGDCSVCSDCAPPMN